MKQIFLFLILRLIFADNSNGDDDKNHFVFSGRCANQHSNFCNDKVENSICNTVKDECFCRKGFVAIREGSKISCKTLLTDLICRVDKDCIHVSGSMCHPGAGQCVCPAQNIYVEFTNSCRKKSEDLSNPLCQICRQRGGHCYKFTVQDRKNNPLKSKLSIGCACNNHKTSSDPSESICDVQLVDIGGYCNDRDLKCRSKKAICSRTLNTDSIFTCNCITGHVPVYQKTLRYFECFPVVSESTSHRCTKCFQSEGYCYDINSDHEGDGCLCQNKFSNENDGVTSLSNPCTINHVSVLCQDNQMTVCYVPHNRPPYRSLGLQLKNGRSLALIKSALTNNKIILTQRRIKTSVKNYSKQFSDNLVKMTTANSGAHLNRFCANVDLSDERIIQAEKLKNGNIRYSASLHVIVDSIKSNPGKDFVFPLGCVGKGFQIKKSKKNKSMDFNNEHFLNLDLRIINPDTNAETNSANFNEQIKLDILLVDSRGRIRCDSDTDYLQQRIVWIRASHGIHYQSIEFVPEPISNSSVIYFHCQIILCKHHTLCMKDTFCEKDNELSRNEEPFKMMERSTYLNFYQTRIPDKISNLKDGDIKECKYSLCLTQIQAIMMTLLMIFLFILVIILVVILRKRQQAIQNMTLKKKQFLLNSPSFYKYSHPYGKKLYLLSDTGSLTTSYDRSESDPYLIKNPRFLQNDILKIPLSPVQDSFSNPFCHDIHDLSSNNTLTLNKSLHISTQINNLTKQTDRTNISDINAGSHDIRLNIVHPSDAVKMRSISICDNNAKTNLILENFLSDEMEVSKDSTSSRSNKDNYYV